MVVGLLAPPSPIENADLERDSQSTELDFGRYVLDVPYSGANLAAELLDPPEGTTLRLEAPLGEIEVFGTSDWTSRMTEEGDANKAVKEMVMPFKKQRGLPWYEASPPADTVIKLRASAD